MKKLLTWVKIFSPVVKCWYILSIWTIECYLKHGQLLFKSVCIRSYSGQHFPAFGLNLERYEVSLRIQSECEKMRTRITQNTDSFYAVFLYRSYTLCIFSFDFKQSVALYSNSATSVCIVWYVGSHFEFSMQCM